MPVLVDALDRSLVLAAAMDSRGYGRRHRRDPAGPAGHRRAARRRPARRLRRRLRPARRHQPRLARAADAAARACWSPASGCRWPGGGCAAASTGRTRGGWPETLVAASGLLPAAVLVLTARVDPGNLYPSLDPLGWPGLPLGAALAVLVGAAAGLAGAAAGVRAVSPARAVARDDPLRGGHRHVRRTPRRRCCGTSRSPSTRASCAWSSAAPGRASPPCSARSTGWCRTSPAAGWPAGSRWTAWTPGPRRRGSSPTWSAWSARTRWPASSPTRSRTSWPTRWSSWRCRRPRCASGSRRPSTCSASPSCAAVHCGHSPAGSSSGSRSGRC